MEQGDASRSVRSDLKFRALPYGGGGTCHCPSWLLKRQAGRLRPVTSRPNRPGAVQPMLLQSSWFIFERHPIDITAKSSEGALMSHRLLSPCSADRLRPFPAPGDPPGHSRHLSTHHMVPLPAAGRQPRAPAGKSRRNLAFHGAPTVRPGSCPVRLAGGRRPRDHNAHFGAVRRSGGGTHLE